MTDRSRRLAFLNRYVGYVGLMTKVYNLAPYIEPFFAVPKNARDR